MANILLNSATMRRPIAALSPRLFAEAPSPILRLPQSMFPSATPAPAPPPASPAPVSAPAVAPAPAGPNPFDELPYPSPGDRIRADDFKRLSTCLRLIYEAERLSSTLFGRTYGEGKVALASQQYVIDRVMSVFGSELVDGADPALDARKIVSVAPVLLGEHRVLVVVTEAVTTQRLSPNLTGQTFMQATAQLRAVLADATLPVTPIAAPSLVGRSLAEAREAIRR